jgi:endonuclease YncB( thermonuclease family)
MRHLILLMVMFASSAWAETTPGRVLRVVDGDTLEVEMNGHPGKVRIVGIDAPESRQPGGAAAKDHLAHQLRVTTINVEWSKTDRYGRILGQVFRGSTDVGLEQIRAGHAWHFKKYQAEQSVSDQAAYSSAETEARTARRGLWSASNPVPPWDWRHGRR